MTDYKKVFVDTAPFIYFIEKDDNNPQYYEKVKKFLKDGYDNDKNLCHLLLQWKSILYSHIESKNIL